MNLTPTQRRMARRIENISSRLRDESFALLDARGRHIHRMQNVQLQIKFVELQIDSKRPYDGPWWRGHAALAGTDLDRPSERLNELKLQLAETKADIAEIECALAALRPDLAPALKLADKIRSHLGRATPHPEVVLPNSGDF